MGRFYGNIGFNVPGETAPGVWTDSYIEHHAYFGDVTRDYRNLETSGSNVNSSPNLNTIIAIVGDEFAFEHIPDMRYVEYLGSKWTIKTVEPNVITVDIDKLSSMLSCGHATARKIGEQAEARIYIGRRVLYSVNKIQRYLDSIAE